MMKTTLLKIEKGLIVNPKKLFEHTDGLELNTLYTRKINSMNVDILLETYYKGYVLFIFSSSARPYYRREYKTKPIVTDKYLKYFTLDERK